MAWPQVLEYNEAIQSPQLCFADAELKQGQPATDAMGWPLPCTGNFAAVYKVSGADQKSWAVKCFTREVPHLHDRYRAISDHLRHARQQRSLRFLIDVDYQDQGILVGGQWFPTLRMEWVEGQTLNAFVGDIVDKPKVVSALSTIWVRLAQDLRAAGIAHGDLQHGNVLLVQGGKANTVRLTLVDYDGMFVPALADKKSGEVGHPNFQHPQRLRDGIYGAEVDQFSHLVIVTALQALLVEPALWQRFNNDENLLFRASDFETPAASPLFQSLWELPAGAARTLAGHLLLACESTVERVPSLERLLRDDRPLPLTPTEERHIGALLNAGRGQVQEPPRATIPATVEVAAPADPPWWASSRPEQFAGAGVTPVAVVAPAPPAPKPVAPPTAAAPTPVAPSARPVATPAEAAAELARQAGIDFSSEIATNCADAAAAQKLRQRLHRELPPVESAYQPSGRIGLEGHQRLLFGAVVGVLVGLLVVAFLNVLIGSLLRIAVNGLPGTAWLVVVVAVLSLAIVALTPWPLGLMIGKLTAEQGKAGKNRNPHVAVGYALGSAATGCFLGLGVYLLSPYNSGLLWPEGLLFTVFLFITILVAWGVAEASVKAARFCEACAVYMTARPLRTICCGGLLVLVRALRQKNMLAAAGVTECAARGHSGQPQLFACPFCGLGYLEVQANFRATTGDRKVKTQESWLAASVTLTADEVKLFE